MLTSALYQKAVQKTDLPIISYRVFAFFSSNFDKGVMTFFYVYAEQVLRGKVLATA